VIAIEAAQRDLFLRRAQLPVHVTMIGAAVRLDGQAAVGPQLSLRAETIRRLQNRDQLRRANRTDRTDDPRPSRITRNSDKRKASNRTMVGT
jgi:hypothetical protein